MGTTNSAGLKTFATYSCPITNFTSAATAYATINWTDALSDIDEYPAGSKCEFIVYWTNNTASTTNYMRLFDQFASAAVSGSEHTEVITSANTYQLSRISTPFDLNSGLTSYMLQVKVSAGTMTVKKVEVKVILP